MSPIIIYVLLLVGIVLGQLFRIPLRPGSELAVRPADLLVLVVDTYWVFSLIKERLRTRQWSFSLQKTDKLFLGFQLLLLVTFALNLGRFNAHDLLIGFGYLVRLQGYLLLYWVARSWGKAISPSVWQRYFIWSAVILAVVGFVQLGFFGDFRFMMDFGWDPHVGRLLSTFYDPNFVGIYLGIGLILATCSLLFGEAAKRRFFLTAALIIFVALYLTYSRSALLATAIPMVILGFRRHWKAGLLTTLIFVIVMFLPGRLGTRFISLFTTAKIMNVNGRQKLISTDDTGNQRLLSWKRGWAVIKFSPIYGVGYNNFGPASAQVGVRETTIVETRGGSAQATDSSLLNIWATSGLFGLVTFLAIAWSLLKECRLFFAAPGELTKERWKVGFGFSLLAIGINSIFINSLLYPQIIIYWLVFAGILISFSSAD